MPPRAEPLTNALAAPSVSHRRLRSYVPGPTPRPVAILQLASVSRTSSAADRWSADYCTTERRTPA